MWEIFAAERVRSVLSARLPPNRNNAVDRWGSGLETSVVCGCPGLPRKASFGLWCTQHAAAGP